MLSEWFQQVEEDGDGQGWPSASIRTLIAVDRLSGSSPQPNLISDWLWLGGWLLQMGSSSSSCHREDNSPLNISSLRKRKVKTQDLGTKETPESRGKSWNDSDNFFFFEEVCLVSWIWCIFFSKFEKVDFNPNWSPVCHRAHIETDNHL